LRIQTTLSAMAATAAPERLPALRQSLQPEQLEQLL
jgi:hypothetical protein